MDTVVITADRAITAPGKSRGPTAVLAVDGAIMRVGDPNDILAPGRYDFRETWPVTKVGSE